MRLKDILEKAEAIKGPEWPEVPDAEVEQCDKVVGELPDDLKGLFAVYTVSHKGLLATHGLLEARVKAADQKLVEGKMGPDGLEKEVAAVRLAHAVAHSEHELVQRCFWGSVRLQFPELIEVSSIGLRKDWKVVASADCANCAAGIELIEISGSLPRDLRRILGL